jgi:monothiol glutaredoxin
MSEVLAKIDKTVKENKVVLYMKGSKEMPMCGFSARVVSILREVGIKDFISVNVLADEAVRQGIKDYTNWPTVPQLFINGEFIGGCDIVTEMHQNGEFASLFE